MPNQQQQAAPGSYFRVPRIGTQKRFIVDAGNQDVNATLSAASATKAPTTKLDQLDILKHLLMDFTITDTYTAGIGETLTQSELFPWNFIGEVSVQFESAFKTYRLNGPLAFAMQNYRPIHSWKGVGMLSQGTVNAQQGETITPALTTDPQSVGLTGTDLDDTTSPINLFLEVPLSFGFDYYWDIDLYGNPRGRVERAVVSPQYMAATTRTVTPQVTYNAGLLVGAGGQALQSPVTRDAGDTTSTFTGTANLAIYRDGYFAVDDKARMPIIYQWQYSRDYTELPTAGQTNVAVPLNSDPSGQGQILSFVFFVWDPELNDGAGGVTPTSAIQSIELIYGSGTVITADTPATNSWRWLKNHGALLPPGFLGWDLALQEDGKLTNEYALNTLVTNGVQYRVVYNSGEAPSSTATIFTGIEMLKAVAS
jgi:hypothetical protein